MAATSDILLSADNKISFSAHPGNLSEKLTYLGKAGPGVYRDRPFEDFPFDLMTGHRTGGKQDRTHG
jgi:hypothetical protein